MMLTKGRKKEKIDIWKSDERYSLNWKLWYFMVPGNLDLPSVACSATGSTLFNKASLCTTIGTESYIWELLFFKESQDLCTFLHRKLFFFHYW